MMLDQALRVAEAPRARDASSARRWLALLTCCAALFLSTLDNTIATVALPSIQRSLHAQLQELQWVIDAYILARAALQFTAGRLADRFGRRFIFQTGLIIFGIGSILSSAAPNTHLLIVFRVFQGVGGAMTTPAGLAIVANTFTDPAERARALGVWGATLGVSMSAGPVVGGALVQAVGWRSIFWINIPVVVVACVLATRVVEESRGEQGGGLDFPGQTVLLLGLASLAYALIQAPTWGWGAGRIVILFIYAAGALTAFIAWERRQQTPLVDLSAFRRPPFAGAAALGVVAFLALGGFLLINSLYLQQIRGFSPLTAGLLTVPATAISLIAAPISGRLNSRLGPRPALVTAFAIFLVALLALSNVTPNTSLTYLIASYALLGTAVGLANPAITTAAMAGMPASRAGIAAATTATARQVGSLLGVALLGSLAFTPLGAESGQSRLTGLHSSPAAHAVAIKFASGASLSYLVAAGLSGICIVIAALAFRRPVDIVPLH